MNNLRQNEESAAGINLDDVYFIVFRLISRHKWVIIVLTMLGLGAAAVYSHYKKSPYESGAKLMVRYVSDNRSLNPVDNNNSAMVGLNELGNFVMAGEQEILNSFDLSKQVAVNIGPEKILAKYGGGNDPNEAAGVILGNLIVYREGTVIHLIYSHLDPDMVQPVLAEIITDYMAKHIQIHKGGGVSDEMLEEETTRLRLQITQTEKELRTVKTNLGVVNVVDAARTFSDEYARIHGELLQAEVQMAEYQVVFNRQSVKTTPDTPAAPSSVTNNVPAETVARYKTISSRLTFLQKREEDFLIQQGFTDDNKLVKEVREQIAEVAKIKAILESQYPSLASIDLPVASLVTAPANNNNNNWGAWAEYDRMLKMQTLPARFKALQLQLARVQADAAKLDESKISDLQRKKDFEEKCYQSFANSLEQARIEETLGPGHIAGISTIQTPSPPEISLEKLKKTRLIIMVSGFGAGLIWALLNEFLLDTTVKRSVEIQKKLKLRVLLSIPDLSRKRRKTKRKPSPVVGAAQDAGRLLGTDEVLMPVVAPVVGISMDLRPYCNAIRDRIAVDFDALKLNRKSRLVAMSSAGKGAGVSTLAAGVAASLSETGDGRVLLVDMNPAQDAVWQFLQGQPGCKLDDIFDGGKRENAKVRENLYVVAENSISGGQLSSVLPKPFSELVPQLKASDFDYIIFDMPPVNPTSVTARLAGCMDQVLLVIESEKTDSEIAKQAVELLTSSKAEVAVVLNRTRNYVPARLRHEFSVGN